MIFAQPFFLFGLLLVSVPIIIHLWFRKKLEKIPFSTLTFLQTSEARRFGWLKFREIAILLLRCLFIATLFLSLARPFTPHTFFGAKRLASIVLIIDNSYSMAYDGNFKKALDAAHELLNSYSPKSECIVLPLCPSDPRTYATRKTWTNVRSAHNAIDNIHLSYQSGSMQTLLTKLSVEEPAYTAEHVYIGDGQEHTFANYTSNSHQENPLYWIKTHLGSNVNIRNVVVRDPLSIMFEQYHLEVYLFNFSTRPWEGRIVIQSGDFYLEQMEELPAMGEGTITFMVPTEIKNGKVMLYSDSLPVDNVYFFSKSIQQRKNVLIIGNDTYLRPGLQPSTRTESPFTVTSAKALTGIDLRVFHTVVLNGIVEITANDRLRLNDFLKQPGRSVLVMLGDQVGENLRTFVRPCCSIEDPISPQGYVTIDWIDETHPTMNVFMRSTALRNVRVFHFHQLAATKGIVAKLTGGYPFIIIQDNCAIVSTQCTSKATDIVYSTVFVPLLYRLISSTSDPQGRKEFYVGERLQQKNDIRSPQGEYLKKEDLFLIPGFYTTENDTFAVNVLSVEGNVKTLGSESARLLDIHYIDLKEKIKGGSLAQLLLYCALVALCLEILLLAFA